MSVSTRLHIQFPPSPPYENTDTLVLTFTTHHLDLRVLRASPSPSPSALSPPIDWAFAGTLTHPTPTRTVWAHRIDSRAFAGVDAGTSSALENGDSLEEGEMAEAGPYREVWRRVPVEGGARAYCLESEEGSGGVKVFVGRVGLYFVCMGQEEGEGEGKEFGARRFQREGGQWREVYRVGSVSMSTQLPEPGMIPEEGVQSGARVEINGVWYTVRESYTTR